MTPGTRIRMNDRCVWPERRGCEGVVVAPKASGEYPQPAKWEVLVLLDDDPLVPLRRDWWTCVIEKKSVDAL